MNGEPRSVPPLTALAAAVATATCLLAAQIGADARWLAAIGAAIVRTGHLPRAIPYAAAPSSWHDAPALGQVIFHALLRAGGDHGLVAAQGAAVAVAFAALAVDMRRARAHDVAGALVLLAVVVAAPTAFLVVRAELFSLALFPLLVVLLRTDAARPSHRIWLAVPLLALWANLYGGVLVGFAVVAVYAVLRRRPLAAAALVASSAAALFATPALGKGLSYYGGVIRGEAAAEHYGLWAPLSLHSRLDVVFVLVASGLIVAALRARLPTWELVVLVGLAAGSIEARRNGIWLVLFVAPVAARGLRSPRATGFVVPPRLAAACFAGPLALAALSFQHAPTQARAGDALLRRAIEAAHGSPILADPVDGEQLAVDGARIWIGNPLDAFSRADQRRYLAWLRGLPAGDATGRGRVRVVLVARGSAAQKRLLHRGYAELAHDGYGAVYRAAT